MSRTILQQIRISLENDKHRHINISAGYDETIHDTVISNQRYFAFIRPNTPLVYRYHVISRIQSYSAIVWLLPIGINRAAPAAAFDNWATSPFVELWMDRMGGAEGISSKFSGCKLWTCGSSNFLEHAYQSLRFRWRDLVIPVRTMPLIMFTAFRHNDKFSMVFVILNCWYNIIVFLFINHDNMNKTAIYWDSTGLLQPCMTF